MQLFNCVCEGNPVLFFENTRCGACDRLVGLVDSTQIITAFNKLDNGLYEDASHIESGTFKLCKNNELYGVCNAMVHESSKEPEGLCFACHFNDVIPDLSVKEHIPLWKGLEKAKRRLLYTLTRLDLPLPDKVIRPDDGLSFNFLTDKNVKDHFRSKLPGLSPVFTGHNCGEITINLSEADDVALSRAKHNMDEQYRTLLGHFRHEIGHFYWDILIAPNNKLLVQCRDLFGDETLDYQEAMDSHYKAGPPENWPENFISAYATMHPWEDWAETWAHFLHMIETLDTAHTHGLLQNWPFDEQTVIYNAPFDTIVSLWVDMSIKLNALNRSMGLNDAYPFVLTPSIIEKLRFVHRVACSDI